MENWCRELNVAIVSRTGIVCEMASCATVESVELMLEKNFMNPHIRAIAWPESRVIESTNTRSIQIIKKYRINDLFDGNTTNILRRQKRETNACNS